MIALWAGRALAFLGKVPWQIWAGLALILAVGLSYCQGHRTGYNKADAEWTERLEKAEREAKAKAVAAERSADEQQQERATEFEAEQEALREIIDESESTGGNPLDSLLGGL